jgi:glucoamylase
VCFDRIAPVYQRYAVGKHGNRVEIWTLAHQSQHITAGKDLRIICESAGVVHWTDDGWDSQHDNALLPSALDLFSVDLPLADLPAGSTVTFTFHWESPDHWQTQDFLVNTK